MIPFQGIVIPAAMHHFHHQCNCHCHCHCPCPPLPPLSHACIMQNMWYEHLVCLYCGSMCSQLSSHTIKPWYEHTVCAYILAWVCAHCIFKYMDHNTSTLCACNMVHKESWWCRSIPTNAEGKMSGWMLTLCTVAQKTVWMFSHFWQIMVLLDNGYKLPNIMSVCFKE